MGRVGMYQPSQASGLGALLANFFRDHPISGERIKKLGEEMSQLCGRPRFACQNR